MSYKKIYYRPKQINSTHAIKKRSIAAELYTQIIIDGKIVVNIDESSIDRTCYERMGWEFSNRKLVCDNSKRLDNFGIIAACSSAGTLHYSVQSGTTNSKSIWFFIVRLCNLL